MEITRREKLLAKVCWPEIDTQRTRFYRADGAASVTFAVVNPSPMEYRPDSAPIDRVIQIGTETVNLGKWVYHGKRRHAVARWGYSSRLDTVVIREVRTAHNWAIDCETCDKLSP